MTVRTVSVERVSELRLEVPGVRWMLRRPDDRLAVVERSDGKVIRVCETFLNGTNRAVVEARARASAAVIGAAFLA